MLIIRREASRPQFSFLSGGPSGAYYKWKLYCTRNNLPYGMSRPCVAYSLTHSLTHSVFDCHADVEPVMSPHAGGGYQPTQQAQPSAPGGRPFTPAEEQEFRELLENLSGTKDSIKSGKNWVMYHVDSAQEIAAGFLNRMRELSEYTKKQHVIYLINDVLFHRYDKTPLPDLSHSLTHACSCVCVFVVRNHAKIQRWQMM